METPIIVGERDYFPRQKANPVKQPLLMLIMLLSMMLHQAQPAASLKVTVAIPELVKLNEPFWLNCSQHGGGVKVGETPQNQEEIYAIKWYKDSEEFYRFLPNAQPKVSIYETNGIQLDQARSHEGNVLVNKADVNSEGLYRCEIIAEAPLFETVAKSKHLKVYALPVRGPRIEILDQQGRPKSLKAADISYAVGDRIELRCNSAPSKPAARLRWYLNDHELQVPASPTSTSSLNHTSGRQQVAPNRQHAPLVKVGAVEYRQQYKNIYSSHSTLSLLLQQEDLINNKISFKCLASMRQLVPLRGKQLIVSTPPPSTSQPLGASRRRRQARLDVDADVDVEEADYARQRQRPQHHRHSISRLASSGHQQQQQQQQQLGRQMAAGRLSSAERDPALISGGGGSLLYIYEDADSTLGPSLFEAGAELGGLGPSASSAAAPANLNSTSSPMDNLELVQLMRERQARHRQPMTSAPSSSSSPPPHNLKRLHGSNFLAKSPLYLDELDPLRPVIGWPPLSAGRLALAGSSILAWTLKRPIQLDPTAEATAPPRSLGSIADLVDPFAARSEPLLLLERLIASLNCTCTESSSETKLGWLVNEIPLELRNTRFYSSRVSPDHRQTWLTVGLQMSSNMPPQDSRFGPTTTTTPTAATAIPSQPPQSLQSILAHHFHREALGKSATPIGASASKPTTAEENQIKFACQAIHSMLLYSSSEMITFDFNPPPQSAYDGPSPPATSNNVIQATSASQSSSARARTNSREPLSRSHATLFALFVSSIWLVVVFMARLELHF